jgi:pyocin large subunit-like protein
MADPLTNGGSSHQNAALLISTYMNSMQATVGGIGQTITSPIHMHQSYQQTSYTNNGGVYATGAPDAKGISNLNSHIRGESQEQNPQSRGGSTTPKPGQAKPTVSTGHRSQQSQYATPAASSQ